MAVLSMPYRSGSRLKADANGLPLIGVHYAAWKKACEDALVAIAHDARFDRARVGVLGFSLGAHYALSVAMDPPAGTSVKCVVDFFGPTLSPPLAGDWSKMPPLLVHHGRDDGLVEPKHTDHLKAQLESARKTNGKDFHIELYDRQGHGFTGDALTKSRRSTVDFFVKHL